MYETQSLFPEPPLLTRPSPRFMLAHPAHAIALGFGSGLSPKAPGTIGTLWAWMAFLMLQPWMNDVRWALLIAVSLPLGWWACMPAGLPGQLIAFGLFRCFDAVKPGPVGWADRLFHARALSGTSGAWRFAGLGILFDDLVAAFCTLLVIALWQSL